ncbi:electron transport complex subunit RsxG [Gynuella sunshinyii]|uniref:Ion-translocating oxidoreductase complex subunit G n=1 Tax=Gynuella sunshinyii YC6258 TaxID=1445510 RepID=A0A0C5VR73_9GAMM|nr:electron transport complex subunit RsxG [Gynuella sunshinyii]AJQ95908.1 putative NADH:ubiquinone oxidoreductase, subunit RnfG [Gynuella sunshinyii YC6258]
MNLVSSIRKNALGLGIFAIFTVGLIAVTQYLSTDRIQHNRHLFQSRLLYEIFPDASEDLATEREKITNEAFIDVQLLSLKTPEPFFSDGQHVILPVIAPNGYTDAIQLLIGIDQDGTIAGVRAIAHQETPGLGDQIDTQKSGWILQFNGKSITVPALEQWKVKKDGGAFDQLTGATITPRAVTAAVKNALLFYQANQNKLLLKGS